MVRVKKKSSVLDLKLDGKVEGDSVRFAIIDMVIISYRPEKDKGRIH